MPLQDRQLDFEDFSSDTEKLSAILKRVEVSIALHKLSCEYYRSRKLAMLYPAVLSCVAIGILGFVVTTDVIKAHMKIGGVTQVEDVLTLVVGFLGIFVGTVMLLMNQWDFGGRESMHMSAMIELDGLGNRVRYYKMDRRVGAGAGGIGGIGDEDSDNIEASYGVGGKRKKALGIVEAPDTRKMALIVASGKKLEEMETEIKKRTNAAKKSETWRDDVTRFSAYNGAYHQINRSCKSRIPNAINRPFDLFESRLECMSLGHLGVIWDTRMRRNQIMRLAALEIYNEIAGYWLWPLGTPDVEKVIDRSMKRVARLMSKDYRAPIEVGCCGFTIFRCCCKKVNNKYNALDNIWDGMEDREREMMEVRGVSDYVDTGDRRLRSGKQFEDHYSTSRNFEEDANRAEQRLMRIRNGEERSVRSQYSRDDYSRDRSEYSQSYYSRAAPSRRDDPTATSTQDRSYSTQSTARESSRRSSIGKSQVHGGGGSRMSGSLARGVPLLKLGMSSQVSRSSNDDYYASGVLLQPEDQSVDDTLTVSEAGWEVASASQFA